MRISQIIAPASISLSEKPTYLELYDAFEHSNVGMIPLLLESGELAGVVYKKDFFLADSQNFMLSEVVSYEYMYEHYHILESLREFLKGERPEMPVIDADGFFIGTCKIEDVQYHFNRTIGLIEGSSMVVIETTLQNYSLVDIGRIVESNQAKVLNFYLSSHPDSNYIEITLVLNVSDIADILASFQRFDYSVTYSSASNDHDDFLKERYDSLMHFLDI